MFAVASIGLALSLLSTDTGSGTATGTSENWLCPFELLCPFKILHRNSRKIGGIFGILRKPGVDFKNWLCPFIYNSIVHYDESV